MRIFLLGDFKSNNGPGNANKQAKLALSTKYKVEYSRKSGKLQRIIEICKEIKKNDILLICSASKINYFAIKIAKKNKKKIIYLMHGYSSYEYKIEGYTTDSKIIQDSLVYEKFIFDNVDCIVCVSKRCMNFMKKQLPQYANKLSYIYNVVDTKYIKKFFDKKIPTSTNIQLLSVGGGMRRKNILPIAQAIDSMGIKANFIVVGKTLIDGEKIKKINCVTWYEHLEHEELYHIMSESYIYIQNSSFETFGLAVIEALYAGCNILVSDEVGCLDLFENIMPTDIIYDVSDQNEISQKIRYLLSNPNRERLLNSLNEKDITKNGQASRWEHIISDIIQT